MAEFKRWKAGIASAGGAPDGGAVSGNTFFKNDERRGNRP